MPATTTPDKKTTVFSSSSSSSSSSPSSSSVAEQRASSNNNNTRGKQPPRQHRTVKTRISVAALLFGIVVAVVVVYLFLFAAATTKTADSGRDLASSSSSSSSSSSYYISRGLQRLTGSRNPSLTFFSRRFFAGGDIDSAILSDTTVQSSSSIMSDSKPASAANGATSPPTTPKMPVYFVSHGGPNIMYDTLHPAYTRLALLGKEITTKVRPRAIVVFSAHWQSSSGPDTIEINVGEHEPLVYDYYGFPPQYYKVTFPNRGSTEVAGRVMDLLGQRGIKTRAVRRGLDHGVFAAFKVMFDQEIGNGSASREGGGGGAGVPIVQVSLFDDDEDASRHIELGRAVEKLREEGILVIVSGMAVHNLRDMRYNSQDHENKGLSYTRSFDEAVKVAVEKEPGAERDESMVALLKRPDARRAHPTFEHLLPIHIGVGAAGGDRGERLWTLKEGSLSWAQFRFGDVPAAAAAAA